MERIVVASGNKGKIKEIKEILKGYEVVGMEELGFTEDVEETGETFYENAAIKARAVCSALGVAAVADDSGLCVTALGGAPGVYSARYSGGGPQKNIDKLLRELEGVEDRTAYFETSLVLRYPDGREAVGSGRTYGKIALERIGEGGFGYDPIFISDDLGKSFGQATDEEKNSVSHRYRAIVDLFSKLEK